MSRAQAIILRDNKILLVNHKNERDSWWCLPGGGIEHNESAEEAIARELLEECNVKATIIRKTSETYYDIDDFHVTFLVDIGDQKVTLGYDPENENKACTLVGFKWFKLNEVSELDRAFLFTAGIMTIEEIAKEVMSWERVISYPKNMVKTREAYFNHKEIIKQL